MWNPVGGREKIFCRLLNAPGSNPACAVLLFRLSFVFQAQDCLKLYGQRDENYYKNGIAWRLSSTFAFFCVPCMIARVMFLLVFSVIYSVFVPQGAYTAPISEKQKIQNLVLCYTCPDELQHATCTCGITHDSSKHMNLATFKTQNLPLTNVSRSCRRIVVLVQVRVFWAISFCTVRISVGSGRSEFGLTRRGPTLRSWLITRNCGE